MAPSDYNRAMKSQKELTLLPAIPVRLTKAMRAEVEQAAEEDGEACLSTEVRRLIRFGLERRRRERGILGNPSIVPRSPEKFETAAGAKVPGRPA